MLSRSELQAREGNQDWLTLLSLPSRPLTASSVGGSRILLAGTLVLAGFALRESAAAAASFNLHDGLSATGILVGSQDMLANSPVSAQMGRDGPICLRGLFLEVLAGNWVGSVWVKAVIG